MGTNEEIKNKYNIKEKQDLITLKDLEEIIGDEGFDGLIEDWNNQIGLFLNDLDKMLDEARAEGYTDERKRCIDIIKEQMKDEIHNEKSPSYNSFDVHDEKLYQRLIDKLNGIKH